MPKPINPLGTPGKRPRLGSYADESSTKRVSRNLLEAFPGMAVARFIVTSIKIFKSAYSDEGVDLKPVRDEWFKSLSLFSNSDQVYILRYLKPYRGLFYRQFEQP